MSGSKCGRDAAIMSFSNPEDIEPHVSILRRRRRRHQIVAAAAQARRDGAPHAPPAGRPIEGAHLEFWSTPSIADGCLSGVGKSAPGSADEEDVSVADLN